MEMTEYQIDQDGGSHWIDADGNECYSTFNLTDPGRKYTLDKFVRLLVRLHETADEGFPGPDLYTEQELLDLARGAVNFMIFDLCAVCEVDISEIRESYMVHDEIWERYGSPGQLCIGCLESRMGRQLTPDDFTGAPVNGQGGGIYAGIFGHSERLRDRLGLIHT
jgi:hypothetical protein